MKLPTYSMFRYENDNLNRLPSMLIIKIYVDLIRRYNQSNQIPDLFRWFDNMSTEQLEDIGLGMHRTRSTSTLDLLINRMTLIVEYHQGYHPNRPSDPTCQYAVRVSLGYDR